VGAAVAAGGAVYFLALFVLREKEWTTFVSAVKARFGKKFNTKV
jgi:hypothetical protein